MEVLEQFFNPEATVVLSHRRCRGGLRSFLKHLMSKRGEVPSPLDGFGMVQGGLCICGNRIC